MNEHQLKERIRALKLRVCGVEGAAGVGWGVLAGIVALIAWAWVDLTVDLPAWLRAAAWAAAAAIALVPVAQAVRRAAKMARPEQLSRALDAVARTPGEIHAGLDLLLHPTGAMAAGAGAVGGITERFRTLAIRRAASLAGSIPASYVAPAQPLIRAVAALAIMAAAIGLFVLIAPRVAGTEFLRLTDPYGDHPPYSPLTFAVEPGNAKVLYGGNLPIKVTVTGGAPRALDLVVLSEDLRGSDRLPMFAEAGAGWAATVTNVTATGWYEVHVGDARSTRFRINVLTVPKIEAAHVRITPPAYTHLPPYEGLIPPGGIAGLPGTTVELTLKSNRPLAGGAVQFTADSKTAPVTLAPVQTGAQEVSGMFVLAASGRLSAQVTDVAGQPSTEPLLANVVLLTDERPFVRILQPMAQSFATPTVELPVEISAEDDYGLSKLQLFRAVNDSEATPQGIPVPATAPTQFSATTSLPLSAYGLRPGDTIKLFAHVEDTNPAGPGESDSSVVVVTIISEADMRKMILARQSMETLQSKYEQANRRVEAIEQQMDELRKELKADSSPLTDAQKKQLDDLAARIEKEAEATREAAKEDLPFDLDQALRGTLGQVADKMDAAKDAVKQMAAQPGLTTAGAKDELNALRKQLEGEHQQFEADATDPIQRLAEVFALEEDQAKFEQAYEHQRDLETRLSSIRDKNGQDNPELKNRMRDLEDEQRQVRQDLQQLTEDIDTHAAQLPDDPSLDTLRTTAQAFSKALRESTIVEEMASGESGLAGFSGLLGHAGAKRAADLMEELLSKCQGMGDQAGNCLKFQPHLASALGDTVRQMLDAEGLGSKPGNGAGGYGGYAMHRNSLENVGLYGRLPNWAQASRLGGGKADRGSGADRWGKDKPGASDVVDAHGKQKASGGSDASVPSQYRRQVGDYFQRVADDLGDQK